ncbi:hypothetical protein JWV37_03505 [Sulfurospirillum sp. T05]|uniref:Uncharacterized protein n=1 Tax=Sulfurospirillum tamanense TaxID=2813362 RepID=A0ABS2WQF8_9BACT|nr:DUF6516 family protein [Sulfurospirillum tamanensis]MBN2963838.1 hypothetical protein [Sulfurospirillum tamanensis]
MHSLENLLSLDGEIFPMDNGYWVKFEAKEVKPSEAIPHGVRYSLTLHDKTNQRILGYDNAHSYKPRNAKYGAKKETWDHIHKRMDTFPYEFDSAGQLMEDFWKAVEYCMYR